jgi:hypothetical protein
MTSRSHPGRNDPCSCGSGRKFKHCCEGRSRRLSFTSWVAIAALVAAAALLAFSIHRMSTGSQPDRGGARDCPTGEVWSEAHGHCHPE